MSAIIVKNLPRNVTKRQLLDYFQNVRYGTAKVSYILYPLQRNESVAYIAFKSSSGKH